MTTIQFPQHFIWGAATSSYQIEGAWRADGKSESIWDRFSHTPGKIKDGGHGDVACDHYHRYADDVALMADLGLSAYRFSIAWPRILPDGRGPANQAGLDFYSRLVDSLLAANITPFATLYHWDMPQTLEDAGGWPVRATAEAFVAYADVVSRHLGDRVKHWITFNEPWVSAFLGYQVGEHAPGRQDTAAAVRAAHHLLLAHGWTVPVLRQNSPAAEVGITLNLSHVQPASSSEADFRASQLTDGYINRWFLDPLYGRQYPADMMTHYAQFLPQGFDHVQPDDMATIAVATDFLGVNYYTRFIVRDATAPDNAPQEVFRVGEPTEMGWEVYPDGLYHLLGRLYGAYGAPKLYITENGCSYGDGPDENGRITDQRRRDYLRDHFLAAHRAIQEGVPLAGYFVWSLMDNFEWAKGYTQRFGVVWVDFATQQRLLKDSAHWYKGVIAANGLVAANGW
ncbi:MAG: beta-glucosidase [Chloroflexi bacterium]|nr:beta-glucosidase [Chloroflexota bacterium]